MTMNMLAHRSTGHRPPPMDLPMDLKHRAMEHDSCLLLMLTPTLRVVLFARNNLEGARYSENQNWIEIWKPLRAKAEARKEGWTKILLVRKVSSTKQTLI
jgi:hypothetical protein